MAIDTMELRQRRAKLIVDARKMTELGETENRNLSGEEQENYDKLFADAGELEKRYLRAEEIQKQELLLDASMDPVRPDDLQPQMDQRTGSPAGVTTTVDRRATDEYRSMYNVYLSGGMAGLRNSMEMRALQADDDVGGGYLVTPEQMATGLLKAVDNLVFMRRRGTVQQLRSSASLGVVSLDTDLDDADWTSEIGTASEDTALAFGKRALTPAPISKLLKISKTLIRKSSLPIENLIRDRMAYKFAITQEKAFLVGHGANQPLGVLTASGDGISTGRDVSTGNTTTAITFDGLKEAKYTLKSQYWPRAAWAFHRDAVKHLAKLKDGEARYIWEQSVRVGEPDRLLGFPMEISEYVSNTFTTGLYVGVLGDWSFYWIVDALPFVVQVLMELYALTNQVGYVGRMEADGMPVLEEAFVRVKLA